MGGPLVFERSVAVSNFGHISGSASHNVEPESHAKGRPTSFAIRVKDRSSMGEPTMVEPTKLLSNALSFTVPPNAVESLEEIRDSY